MKAEKQEPRLVQDVCAGMAGLECAVRASAAQCQQARQSMQKRSANGRRAKEDCAGEVRDVIVNVLVDDEQLGWRAPVLQMLCSMCIAVLLRRQQRSGRARTPHTRGDVCDPAAVLWQSCYSATTRALANQTPHQPRARG